MTFVFLGLKEGIVIMKKICKSIMAVFFAAVLLVTLPGVCVLADEFPVEEMNILDMEEDFSEDIMIDNSLEICDEVSIQEESDAEIPTENATDESSNVQILNNEKIGEDQTEAPTDEISGQEVYLIEDANGEERCGYTNHSRDEAVAWITARKNEKWAVNYDGIYGPQCVDLIMYYFDYLVGYHLGGSAYQYVGRTDLPSGWYYTSTPSPGDIAVWEANVGIALSTGHVALVQSVGSGSFSYVDVNGATGRAGSGSISNTNPSTFIHPDFVEYKAPDIKNAHITNATTASYEVRFNAYDDSRIDFAQVGCWSDKWDIDKAKWYTVPFSNNYGAITIPVSDMGGYKDCWYYCNIYVVDEFGNKSEATTVKVFIDGTAPQIKNAHTTNTTTTSYEVRFNAYDDSDITFAQVGCWSDKWDIDKAKWYTVPFSNNYGAITIPISDMGGYKDCWYYCNIYTLDAFGNRSNATTVKVYICDINSTNHNWGDPIWKWTGNDANGYSAATATVTCKTDKSHKMTFKATVTKKASGTGKNAKMTYAATATISGKKFTTTKTVAIKMALVSSASVGKLKTIKLTPVLTPKDTPVEAYTWKSSKPAAAKVNSSGTVTGANLGQTDITATCSKYGLSAKCTVNVWFNDVMPKDVPAGITKENYQYIYWGVKNGIINGYSDGSFKPNNPVTRAQFCIMIWKLAGKPAPSSKAASFKDISGLTANGQKAIKWAQEKGLVNGFGNGIFKPNDVLTRCQIMIILWKWSGRPAYGNMAKYSDISALTLNTQKAISWGVNNRIISASGNKFTPNGNVSRADFLNILYQFNKVSYKKIPSNLDAVPKQ